MSLETNAKSVQSTVSCEQVDDKVKCFQKSAKLQCDGKQCILVRAATRGPEGNAIIYPPLLEHVGAWLGRLS